MNVTLPADFSLDSMVKVARDTLDAGGTEVALPPDQYDRFFELLLMQFKYKSDFWSRNPDPNRARWRGVTVTRG